MGLQYSVMKHYFFHTVVICVMLFFFEACNTYSSQYSMDAEHYRELESSWLDVIINAETQLDSLGTVPELAKSLKSESRILLADIKEKYYTDGTITRFSVTDIKTMILMIQKLSWNMENLLTLQKAGRTSQPWAFFVTEAISDTRIVPNLFPIPGLADDTVKVSLCRGEYESASFVILALENLEDVKITISDLDGPGIIPSSAVDCSLVKTWWQAGKTVFQPLNIPTLAPELLLKDDSLVKVEYDNRRNFIRSTKLDGSFEYLLASGKNPSDLKNLRPVDAEKLQPFDILTNRNQQIWLTIAAPETAISGTYSGIIEISSRQFKKTLKLQVEVHPFILEPSPLIYSLYYRGKLAETETITSENKTNVQYLAEMRDLKAHGVLYPTIYEPFGKSLEEALELRAQAGLPVGPLYSLGIGTGNPTSQAELEELKSNVAKWQETVGKYGYDELYVYGMDEAIGKKLISQRKAWQAVHEAGAKVFVATFPGNFSRIGNLLDLPILAFKPNAKEAKLYHSKGNKIFSYLYPQVGEETPLTYRRNFGLVLYKAKYDGSMDYAYQHGFGHVWNDFDGWPWRDHNFTYPTPNGVIGTRQWEGFREAVDDVRYLATLEKAIEGASPEKSALAAQAKSWMSTIDPNYDLPVLRKKLVDWIILLMPPSIDTVHQ